MGLMALGLLGVEVRGVHVYGLRRFIWTGFSFWLSVLVFQDVGLDGLRSGGGGVCSDGVATIFSIQFQNSDEGNSCGGSRTRGLLNLKPLLSRIPISYI